MHNLGKLLAFASIFLLCSPAWTQQTLVPFDLDISPPPLFKGSPSDDHSQAAAPRSPLISGIPQDSWTTEFVLGFPIFSGLFQAPFVGARMEYDFLPSGWGVELGYAFHSKSYFFFDHTNRFWYGPVPWNLSPEAGNNEDDWPFYQTRHILSPGVVYKWPKDGWQLKAGLGFLLQFFVLPESSDYYPDFKNAFDLSQVGVSNFLGNYVKFGADFQVVPVLSFGGDFVFEVPSWPHFVTEVVDQFWIYVRSNAHIQLRVGFRI